MPKNEVEAAKAAITPGIIQERRKSFSKPGSGVSPEKDFSLNQNRMGGGHARQKLNSSPQAHSPIHSQPMAQGRKHNSEDNIFGTSSTITTVSGSNEDGKDFLGANIISLEVEVNANSPASKTPGCFSRFFSCFRTSAKVAQLTSFSNFK